MEEIVGPLFFQRRLVIKSIHIISFVCTTKFTSRRFFYARDQVFLARGRVFPAREQVFYLQNMSTFKEKLALVHSIVKTGRSEKDKTAPKKGTGVYCSITLK